MDVDPIKVVHIVEKVLGRRPTRLLTIAVIYLGIAMFAVWAISFILNQGIIPIFLWLRDSFSVGVTLDNIEVVVISAVIAVLLFFILLVFLQFLLFRALRRRAVPQRLIDGVAEKRSEGISILNDRPKDAADFDRWKARWLTWHRGVVDYLQEHFTVAEKLQFDRLGLVPERNFGSLAVTPEHAHSLMQLAKQLVILEDLISRHLERR